MGRALCTRESFCLLLGALGSGESTLLNILDGLNAPSSDSVHFVDQDLSQASEDELTSYRREHRRSGRRLSCRLSHRP